MSLQLITVKSWDISISNNTPIIHNMLEIAFQVILSKTIRVMRLLLLLLLIIVIMANILYNAYSLSDTIQNAAHILTNLITDIIVLWICHF